MKAYGIPVQSIWKQQQPPLQPTSLSSVTANSVSPVLNGVGVTVANPHHTTTAININSFIKAEPVVTQHSTVSATVVASPTPSTRVGTCTVNQPIIAAATPSSPSSSTCSHLLLVTSSHLDFPGGVMNRLSSPVGVLAP